MGLGWGMGYAVSPFKRQRIIEFDSRVAGVSVEEFCRQVGVSKSSFYRIRKRAKQEGPGAALVARSRAPLHPARRWDERVDERIAQVRRELVADGKDAGAWSVWWVLSGAGANPAPSRATIARRMRAMGLVVPAPRKRPRVSFKRFTRTSANELWQLDGIEWRIQGRVVTIYQVIDDCSRVLVALKAAWGGETHEATRQILSEAFDSWGRPAAILTDNGRAFNTHRTTGFGRTERWLASLGIRPISGAIGHPQTQGKVESSHKPLQLWLEAHPYTTLEDLNTGLECFTAYYNTERQHQGLGIAITPIRVWHQVPRALPNPSPINLDALSGPVPLSLPQAASTDPAITSRQALSNGSVTYKGRIIYVGSFMAGQRIEFRQYPTRLDLYDQAGTHFAAIPWPQPTQAQTHSRATINASKPPNRIISRPPRSPRSQPSQNP